MATGTKNFYSRPKTDLEVARPLLTLCIKCIEQVLTIMFIQMGV
mgnify:CR=1 FL=1